MGFFELGQGRVLGAPDSPPLQCQRKKIRIKRDALHIKGLHPNLGKAHPNRQPKKFVHFVKRIFPKLHVNYDVILKKNRFTKCMPKSTIITEPRIVNGSASVNWENITEQFGSRLDATDKFAPSLDVSVLKASIFRGASSQPP